jgi:hypothetical protein
MRTQQMAREAKAIRVGCVVSTPSGVGLVIGIAAQIEGAGAYSFAGRRWDGPCVVRLDRGDVVAFEYGALRPADEEFRWVG